MAWDVHIHVSFACISNAGVASLAAKHLELFVDQSSDAGMAVRWFLEDLSGRTGCNRGPKGGLSLWGMVGNYTRVDDFCEQLRPFWRDLLSGVDGGPCSFERVVVFEEQEQYEAATAYEIMWDDELKPDREIVIRKHERLPFSWRQM